MSADPHASNHPRFRISLLTTLLLMTIAALVLVVIQLWREVGPLRAEVKMLRTETGRLHIEDKSQLAAIQIDTKDDLIWKWRIWVPENHAYKLRITGETIPKKGIPDGQGMISVMEPGEHVVEYRIQRNQKGGPPYGTLHYESGRVGHYNAPWIDWTTRTSEEQSVGRQTATAKPNEPFILIRKRVSKATDSSQIEDPSEGFMIWIE